MYRNLNRLKKHFKHLLANRRSRLEKENRKQQMNIVDRFKLRAIPEKFNTLNILSVLKNKPLARQVYQPSKFCLGFKKQIEKIQMSYNLYELDYRRTKTDLGLLSRRRLSLEADRNVFRISNLDKFNLSGSLRDHYLNMQLIQKREREKIEQKIQGEKEEGDYVHIEDSAKRINETEFLLDESLGGHNQYSTVLFNVGLFFFPNLDRSWLRNSAFLTA